MAQGAPQTPGAAAQVMGAEPQYTSCHGRFTGTVDYIWFTPDSAGLAPSADAAPAFALRSARVLAPPDFASLHCGLPSPEWPSDHVALMAEFVVTAADGRVVPLGRGAATEGPAEGLLPPDGSCGTGGAAPSAPPLPAEWPRGARGSSPGGSTGVHPSPGRRGHSGRRHRGGSGDQAQAFALPGQQGGHWAPHAAAGSWDARSAGAPGASSGGLAADGPVMGVPVGGPAQPVMSVAYVGGPAMMGYPMGPGGEPGAVAGAGGEAQPPHHIRFGD